MYSSDSPTDTNTKLNRHACSNQHHTSPIFELHQHSSKPRLRGDPACTCATHAYNSWQWMQTTTAIARDAFVAHMYPAIHSVAATTVDIPGWVQPKASTSRLQTPAQTSDSSCYCQPPTRLLRHTWNVKVKRTGERTLHASAA